MFNFEEKYREIHELNLTYEAKQTRFEIIDMKKNIIEILINYYNDTKDDLEEQAYLELKEATAFCLFGHYNHIDNYYIELGMIDTRERMEIMKATKKALKVFTDTGDLIKSKGLRNGENKENKYFIFDEKTEMVSRKKEK